MAEKRFEDMTFDDLIESKYMKGDDMDERGAVFTIKSFTNENMALEDQKPEFKWVMYLRESEKGLVLGSTNIQLLKAALGINRPAESIGRKVVIFRDPTVQMKGKVVGGLRLRAPRLTAPPPDDIPDPRQAPPRQDPNGPRHQPQQRDEVAEDYRRGTGRADNLSDDIPF